MTDPVLKPYQHLDAYGTLRIITNAGSSEPGDDVYIDDTKIGTVVSCETGAEKTSITVQITDFDLMKLLVNRNAEGGQFAFSIRCSKCGKTLD